MRRTLLSWLLHRLVDLGVWLVGMGQGWLLQLEDGMPSRREVTRRDPGLPAIGLGPQVLRRGPGPCLRILAVDDADAWRQLLQLREVR